MTLSNTWWYLDILAALWKIRINYILKTIIVFKKNISVVYWNFHHASNTIIIQSYIKKNREFSILFNYFLNLIKFHIKWMKHQIIFRPPPTVSLYQCVTYMECIVRVKHSLFDDGGLPKLFNFELGFLVHKKSQ